MNSSINKHRFNIVVNSAGQRILIVDDQYRTFVYEAMPFDSFDAIFCETEDYTVLRRQISSLISVETTPNYSFKPLFVKPVVTNKRTLVFADGVCSSIESTELIQVTKRIQERFISLRFQIFDREPSFWTVERRIFHIVRNYLLRSDQFPEYQLQRHSAMGYEIARFELMIKYKIATVNDVNHFLNDICIQNKLLKFTNLVAIIELCPHCHEGRLIWQETCPKCGTIDIEEVNMIHHFRCANISSEESYIKDGKLVCPKCRLELKHIGVDYDRPASMYFCREHNMHFSTATIKALCTNCHHTSELSQLQRKRIYNREYTTLGVTTFAHCDHIVDSDDVPKMPSIYSYNSFIQALKIRVDIARHNPDLRTVVYRLRITPESDELADRHIVKRIYYLYPNIIISYSNNTYYVLQGFVQETTEEIAAKILRFKEHNNKYKDYTFDGEYIEIDVNMEIDRIIALL